MGLKTMCVYISVSVCLFLDTLMWQTRTQRGSCGCALQGTKTLKTSWQADVFGSFYPHLYTWLLTMPCVAKHWQNYTNWHYRWLRCNGSTVVILTGACQCTDATRKEKKVFFFFVLFLYIIYFLKPISGNCKTQILFYIEKLWRFEDLKSETGCNNNSKINLALYGLGADKKS